MVLYKGLIVFVILLMAAPVTAVMFIGGDGEISGCSSNITDDFDAGLIKWNQLSGTWTISASEAQDSVQGVMIYDDEQTCTVTQWAMVKFNLPGSGAYGGLYMRSQNSGSTYAYAVRYEQPATQFAWRYCGGGDHSNDPDSCTTIDSGGAVWSRTLDDNDYYGVEITGTSTSTEVKIYDLGVTAISYPNWAASADSMATLTNDPDQDAATGRYVGLYNGASQTIAFDDFAAGSP